MPLSDEFMSALETGHLKELRTLLLHDRTLCPEIREDTLTIYYRGKSLSKIQRQKNRYIVSFDSSYVLQIDEPAYNAWVGTLADLPSELSESEDVSLWVQIMPCVKGVMDRWFAKKGGLEREAQQLLVQENNRDKSRQARCTDYFFCDMERVENIVELDGKKIGLRFDLVGVHWPSTASERKTTKKRRLVVAEVKYGDGAHAGDSGLVGHLRGLLAFSKQQERIEDLKRAMITTFNQKQRLCFVECERQLESFAVEPTLEWLIIFVNHDPEKSRLQAEINDLQDLMDLAEKSGIQIKVAQSNFMGYGLWDEAILSIDELLGQQKRRLSASS